jgi:hypothetical protein
MRIDNSTENGLSIMMWIVMILAAGCIGSLYFAG